RILEFAGETEFGGAARECDSAEDAGDHLPAAVRQPSMDHDRRSFHLGTDDVDSSALGDARQCSVSDPVEDRVQRPEVVGFWPEGGVLRICGVSSGIDECAADRLVCCELEVR